MQSLLFVCLGNICRSPLAEGIKMTLDRVVDSFWIGTYDGADVPDPYFFKGFEGFERVYEMLEICINNLFSVEFLYKEKE